MKKFLVLIVFVCIILGLFYLIKNKQGDGNSNEFIEDIPDIEISENVLPDEEKPDDVIYINISSENKILCCSVLDEFENGQNLTTEQYLQVAYYVLNNGYVESEKDTFSVDEINNIIYSIFNVKIEENKSIDGLEFQDGKYKIEKNAKDNRVLKIIERSTAAGSTYVVFENNGESYIARVLTNTVTGDNYIQSIIKE